MCIFSLRALDSFVIEMVRSFSQCRIVSVVRHFPLCNLSPLFVSLLKHVGMRRLLEINDDRKQYHHFSPLVHISLCSLDILKIFFARDIFYSEACKRIGERAGTILTNHPTKNSLDKFYSINKKSLSTYWSDPQLFSISSYKKKP